MSKRVLHEKELVPGLPLAEVKLNCLSFAVVLGLGGGLFSVLLGGLLTVVTWFTTWHEQAFRYASTVFFVSAIPLLVIGAHCLDLVDAEASRKRSLISSHTETE